MLNWNKSFVILAIACVAGARIAEASVVIENFDKNQASGTATVTGTMLGGDRDITATAPATAQVKTGVLFYSSAGGGSVQVVWNGSGTLSPAVDLTAGAQNALVFGINSADTASATIAI